jgi:hypothetical protein
MNNEIENIASSCCFWQKFAASGAAGFISPERRLDASLLKTSIWLCKFA